MSSSRLSLWSRTRESGEWCWPAAVAVPFWVSKVAACLVAVLVVVH
jgi:hypothetical protein